MPDVVIPAEVREAFQYLIDAARSQGRGAELVVALLHEAANVITENPLRGSTLSGDQAAYLIESGDFTAEELAKTQASVARGELAEEERRTKLRAVAASLSSAEVAQRLGIDASRVRHRQASGNLYAFKVGGKRRYPTWQFTDDPARPVFLVSRRSLGLSPMTGTRQASWASCRPLRRARASAECPRPRSNGCCTAETHKCSRTFSAASCSRDVGRTAQSCGSVWPKIVPSEWRS